MSQRQFAQGLYTIAISALLAACSGGTGVGPQVPTDSGEQSQAPQQLLNNARERIRYREIDMGTFGGPTSQGTNLTLGGPLVVVGWSATSMPKPPQSNRVICGGQDGFIPNITHTFQWRDGNVTDLGTLGGPMFCSEPFWINNRGESVGISENGLIDSAAGRSHPNCDNSAPLGPALNQSRPVLWNNGQIVDLGTFGGNQGIALSSNNRGQIAGAALNAIPDPYSFWDIAILCTTQGTQTRGFLWQNGHKIDLGTLGGSDTYAEFVNERGQVSGSSYTNNTPNPVTGLPTLDPFLWQNGKMRDLGTLGGTFSVTNAMNNRGEVVGQSNLAGDLVTHPFVWDGSKLIDIGTAGGDMGFAWAINDAGEVVGWSFTAGDAQVQGFIWKDGARTDLPPLPGACGSQAEAIDSGGRVLGQSAGCSFGGPDVVIWDRRDRLVDLNSLIAADSPLHLSFAGGPLSVTGPLDINDRGDVAGIGSPAGVSPVDAQSFGHAFLLIPCERDQKQCEGDKAMSASATRSNAANYGASFSMRDPARLIDLRRARWIGRFRIHFPAK